MPPKEAWSTPETAIAFVACVLAVGLLLSLRALIRVRGRQPDDDGGNGQKALDARVHQITANLELVNSRKMDLPKFWRDQIDERIQHKLANHESVCALVSTLIEQGRAREAIKILTDHSEGE